MKNNRGIYATSLIQIDEPLSRISTIIQFHLRQTPANLTATSSPSEENIWATRRGAPVVTPPKWTGCLEMAITTTAITGFPPHRPYHHTGPFLNRSILSQVYSSHGTIVCIFLPHRSISLVRSKYCTPQLPQRTISTQVCCML